MTCASHPQLLVLHGVRLLGFADAVAVSHRFALDLDQVAETLEDFRAFGWVDHSTFVDLKGWSLTEAGRSENQRQLAAELDDVGCRRAVDSAYREFLPFNARLQRACTDWQLRPTATDQLAENDHTDQGWDHAVLNELAAVQRGLVPVEERLSGCLPRMGGYDARFTTALRRATAGDTGWINRTDVDSCHRVWFELHEDLIATLGLIREARY